MTDKEATVYIIDVGRSMSKTHYNREESDLDWSMRYVWDKISTTVSTGRKTLLIGVLGLRTNGTQNDLHEDPEDSSYANISILHPISQFLMPDLRNLREAIKPSRSDHGDAISAIIIAVKMIIDYCKALKYKRKIVLVTDGKGPIESDEESYTDLVTMIKEKEIELTILGIDFDDAAYGFKEEGKSSHKSSNEITLRELAEQCNGVFGTIAQAIDELDIPRLKVTRPMHSYRGLLTLGNPKDFDTALAIEVERYPRTMVAKAPSASSFVLRSTDPAGSTQSTGTVLGDGHDRPGSNDAENPLANVRNTYAYSIVDADAPGGKRDVERDDLAKGYEYGRTVVHISESDENITKLDSTEGMEIVGFVHRSKYERYMSMGISNIVVAQKTNDKAILALSSFIHALFELESCAIARVVKKNSAEPVLTILSPSVEPDFECLVENQLPFNEDVRIYRFPPLDKMLTVSGKVIEQHRNLPDKDLRNAMDKFVDSMDISQLARTDEGDPAEYMALEDVFSPVLHRIEQVKRWRAVRPHEAIPPVPEILLKYSQQPKELGERAKPALERLIKAADVKKVPPKTKGRKRNRDLNKPLSGLNVEDLFAEQPKRAKISSENSIPEFKQLLSRAESISEIRDAVTQMATIIEAQIQTSFGDSEYARAIEGLGVVRSELMDLEEPVLYNEVVRTLKKKILGGKLGGDRREMWWNMRRMKVGLIDKKVSSMSDVSDEEAKKFMAAQ